MRKVFLGTFSAFCYVLFVFLGGYNSQTTENIKLKFSTFFSCVEVTKFVKFQIPRFMGIEVGIFFRISPIGKKAYEGYFSDVSSRNSEYF